MILLRSIALFTEAVADACIVGSKAATGLKQETIQSGPSIVRKAEDKNKEENKADTEKEISTEEGTKEETPIDKTEEDNSLESTTDDKVEEQE